MVCTVCQGNRIGASGLQKALNFISVIRDPDGHVYFREWNGGIMAGGFEPPSHGGKPVFHTGIPEKFAFQLLPEDWDHFRKSWITNASLKKEIKGITSASFKS